MGTASHKIIGFSLVFPLLLWGMAATAMHLPTVETLVEYRPDPDMPPCRAVRISEGFIATSHLCAQKAREFSNYRLIEVYTLTGEPVGAIAEQSEKFPENGMLLQVVQDTKELRSGNYPALYSASSTPDQAFTYSVDENYQMVRQPVVLAADEAQVNPAFIISSEPSLPLGAPVFDIKNQLVCLSDGSNQCFTVGKLPVVRFRRGLKDYPDDPNDDDFGPEVAEIFGITAGVTFAVYAIPAAIATITFYLASYRKARSMGMPANIFWTGILSLKYCGHCNSNSALYAILGLVTCPICLCPLSAYFAASNWIEDYAAPSSEHAPIIQPPPLQAPSQ